MGYNTQDSIWISGYDTAIEKAKKVINQTKFMNYIKPINSFSNDELDTQIRKDMIIKLEDNNGKRI